VLAPEILTCFLDWLLSSLETLISGKFYTKASFLLLASVTISLNPALFLLPILILGFGVGYNNPSSPSVMILFIGT
jgi:hypothetical protein